MNTTIGKRSAIKPQRSHTGLRLNAKQIARCMKYEHESNDPEGTIYLSKGRGCEEVKIDWLGETKTAWIKRH
ncbi:hypothetical protein [Persicirhabdus sediminis]|uniref:Uncharacterized protein n=1 Tax=Persicirhabdus sediminis TaxID=454144 RepID=A0A8J7MDS2_9BACT|nr:hypothetical protein [Persicirhabdus sediminis]MBK1790792.1 hypothetical protein [Persicirhabdus sediminis]